MSFVDYTRFAAYPQYQVPNIIRDPATGQSAPVSQAIPRSSLATRYASPVQLSPLSQETQPLLPVRATSQFGAKMAPILYNSRAEGLQTSPQMGQTLQNMQNCCVRGHTQNQFFSGTFYSLLR